MSREGFAAAVCRAACGPEARRSDVRSAIEATADAGKTATGCADGVPVVAGHPE